MDSGHLFAASNPKQFATESQGLSKDSGKFVPSRKILELRNKLLKFMENRIYPLESKFNELAQSNMRWTVHPERVTLLSKELKIDFVLEVSVVKASQIRLDTNCKVTWGFKVNFSEEKFPAWAKGVSYCSRFFYIRFEGNSNCLSS